VSDTAVLKIDEFSDWDGTFPLNPPDNDRDWEIVSADVRTDAPTPKNQDWITKVAVVWRVRRAGQ
jgi:hypothetical protein